jgi:DNA-binding CsgD family transcriptional regulator
MTVERFSRVLGGTLIVLGALNTIWAVSLPQAAHPPAVGRVLLWLTLLLASGVLYLVGARFRDVAGRAAYLVSQSALAFAIAATGAQVGVRVAVFAGLTAQAILLYEGRGSIAITAVAVLLFAAAAAVGSTLYGAVGAAIVLVAAGIIAHAIAAVLRVRLDRRAESPTAPPRVPTRPPVGSLTQREQEVLDILATGARTTEIASRLGVTERTAKAHLSSIYQKLGVSSRGEAIAHAYAHRDHE